MELTEEIKDAVDEVLSNQGSLIVGVNISGDDYYDLVENISKAATALLERERAEGIKLTPSLKQELERMNEKGQDTLAWLLYYASAMGDYGDPCGVWAVVSPDSGKVLVTEKDCPELAQPEEGK